MTHVLLLFCSWHDSGEDAEKMGNTRARLEDAKEELRRIVNKALDDAVRDMNVAEINKYV